MTEYNFNYYEKMVNDLLEQFRGRKNIGVLPMPGSSRRSMSFCCPC